MKGAPMPGIGSQPLTDEFIALLADISELELDSGRAYFEQLVTLNGEMYRQETIATSASLLLDNEPQAA